MRLPGPSLKSLLGWIGVFIFFTTLQLKYNKTPFFVKGMPLISVSDVIEFAVPLVVLPYYWYLYFESEVKINFRNALPMIISSGT